MWEYEECLETPRPNDRQSFEDSFSTENFSWQKLVFPTLTPSSRGDVKLLDSWLNIQLSTNNIQLTDQLEGGGGEFEDEKEEELTRELQRKLEVLGMGIHEIVRQVRINLRILKFTLDIL